MDGGYDKHGKHGKHSNSTDLVSKITHSESITARYVAVFREMCNSDQKYNPHFNDPYAKYFANDAGRQRVSDVDKRGAVYESVILRLIRIDACIRWVVANYNVTQVVLLGSGFDARSARLKFPNVKYYEVDHPATLDAKLEAIASIDVEYTKAVYVKYNFMKDTGLANKLVESGFDVTKPALYVWEGVTMYLTEDAVRKTLTDVAAIHNTNIKNNSAHIVFDYFTREIPPTHSGEPFIWWAHHTDNMVAECGWTAIREDTLAAVHLNLFGKRYPGNSSANIALCSKLSTPDGKI